MIRIVLPKNAADDPLPRRDSAGNLAPIAQFSGDFNAWRAANYFAGLATPEPRRAKLPIGNWAGDGNYSGYFKLTGWSRTYMLTYDKVHESWRVYMLPKGTKVVG